MNDPALSPIVGHAGILGREGASDLAWITPDGLDVAALLPILLVMAACGFGVWRGLTGRELPSVFFTGLICLLIVVSMWAMWRNSLHPLDEFHRPHPALDEVAANAEVGDGVLLFVPEFTRTVLDNYPGFPPAWGMPPLTPPEATLERAFDTAMRRHERLWVISWFTPSDQGAWAEAYLAGEHYAIPPRVAFGSFWVGCYVLRRLDESWRPADWELDTLGIRLAETSVTPEEPMPGDDVYISLRWEIDSDVEGSYATYVHLLDASGWLHTQADHVPQNGFRPTFTWRRGETVVDRFVLTMPATLPPGEYAIRVGMYDWRSPDVRLIGRTPEGRPTDGFTVLRFRVR